MSGSLKIMEVGAQLNYQIINKMWYKVFKFIMKICNKLIQTRFHT